VSRFARQKVEHGEAIIARRRKATVTNPPNKPTSVTIFGRVPALQDVSQGAYADSIQVMIDF
jgi:spore coat protein U-like protein